MALEQFSKRQKYFLVFLTIAGGVMFTITGQMLSVLGGEQGESRGVNSGTFDGNDVSRELHMMRRQVIATFGATRIAPQVPLFPDASISDQLIFLGSPEGQQSFPLFELWPEHHDERVWYFTAAVQQALDAGFQLPTVGAANEWYFSQIGEKSAKWGEELNKHFNDLHINREPYLQAIAEFMLVSDYVRSVVNRMSSNELEQLKYFAFRNIEHKARIYSLKGDDADLMRRAKANVDRAAAQAPMSEALSSLVGAGGVFPNSSIESTLVRNASFMDSEAFRQETEVAFDYISAEYDDLSNQIRTSLEERQSFYENVRGEAFRATANDVTDAKLTERLNAVTKAWKEMEGKSADYPASWTEAKRAELKTYLDFTEVEQQVEKMIARVKAMQAAKIAMDDISRDFTKIRSERSDNLRAKASTLNDKSGIYNDEISMLTSIQSGIDSLRSSLLVRFESALNSYRNNVSGDAKTRSRMLGTSLSSAIGSTDNNSSYTLAKNLLNNVNLHQKKNMVAEQEVNVEEKTTTLAKRSENGGEPTAEEKELPERARAQLERVQRGLALAESIEPVLRRQVEAFQNWLADVQLEIQAIAQSPEAGILLEARAQELMVEFGHQVDAYFGSVLDENMKSNLETSRDRLRAVKADADKDISRLSSNLMDIDLNQRVAETIKLPMLGVTEQGPVSIKLTYHSEYSQKPVKLSTLAGHPDFYWMDKVAGVRSFFTGVQNHKGMISDKIERDGVGIYIIRITDRLYEHKRSPEEDSELARTLAIGREYRRLAAERVNQIVAEANKQASPAEYMERMVQSNILEAKDTTWFGWNSIIDRSEVSPAIDLSAQSYNGLSAGNPSKPFFDALRSIGPGRSVSAAFMQSKNDFNRIELTQNSVVPSCAMLTGSRISSNAVLPGAVNELYAYDGQIRGRTQAMSAELMKLLNPKALVGERKIEYFPDNFKEPEHESDSNGDEA